MMKSKNLFYLFYFVIFVFFGFYNYLYPSDRWLVLIYTLITMFLLIRAEALYGFKASKHIIVAAILLILIYGTQSLIASSLSLDRNNFPGNNAIVFEMALSILTIFKILNYKIK